MVKSPTSRWVAGAAGVCAALLLITWFVLVGPRRAEAADLTDQAASVAQQNDALQLRTAQLKAQFATLPQRRAELATLIGQLPVTGDVPRFVRSLDALADSAGVSLDGVTPAAGASLSAAPGAGTAAGTAPVAAQQGGLDVVGIPMTVVVRGPYFKTVTFLKGLQSGQRAFLVNGVQVAVAEKEVVLTVRGSVFALPGAAAAIDGTAPTAAATTTTGATPGAAGTGAPFGAGQAPAAGASGASTGTLPGGTTPPAAPAQGSTGAGATRAPTP